MTSYASLVTKVRGLLRESSASTWEDADLAALISEAEQWFATYLSAIRGSGRFEYEEQFTVAADTETFDTTTLTKADAAAGHMTNVRWIMMLYASTWQPVFTMPDGDENLQRLPAAFAPSPGFVPKYKIRDELLEFLPTSPDTRTFRISYNWVPIAKGVGGTSETPARYNDILARRAAYDALGIIGQNETTFEEKYAARLAEITDFESNRINKGTAEVVKNVTSRALYPYS